MVCEQIRIGTGTGKGGPNRNQDQRLPPTHFSESSKVLIPTCSDTHPVREGGMGRVPDVKMDGAAGEKKRVFT